VVDRFIKMMFSAFERLVAGRYLRARRNEGFISVIAGFSLTGIALGVATLIIVMSVMNGFRAELMGRILGLNGHLSITDAKNTGLKHFDEIQNHLRKIDGIVRVTPIIEGQAMSTVSGVASGVLVRGIRPADIRVHPAIEPNIVDGDLNNFLGSEDIVVGKRFAELYNLKIGDKVTLVAPSSRITPFGSIPRLKGFRVKAVFEIGMYEYDNSFLFINLKTARAFFRTGPGKITHLEVMLTSPEIVNKTRNLITKQSVRDLRIVDWQKSNASFFNAIQVERNVMFLILTLIIIVAAFNVISALIMMVKDKGRDIAILRTMGATRGMIMKIFLLSGMSVGFIGTFVGCCLGLAFSLNIETIRRWLEGLTDSRIFEAEIYFLSKLPAKVDSAEVLTVIGISLSLSFLATLYPSWRAARLEPVDALRYE